MHAIFCHICNRPIHTGGRKRDYQSHFQRIHPKEKIPFNLTTRKKQKNSDLITLNGSGIKTQWKMPLNLTKCPVVRCPQNSFVNRSDLITHYKKEHSSVSIYCCICDKPVISRNRSHFITHYKLLHLNILDPFDFDANEKQAKISKRQKVYHLFISMIVNNFIHEYS